MNIVLAAAAAAAVIIGVIITNRRLLPECQRPLSTGFSSCSRVSLSFFGALPASAGPKLLLLGREVLKQKGVK